MEEIIRVVSETHSLILSGKPSGYGWLLGIFVGLFYVSAGYMAWGLIKSVLNGDIWEFIKKIEHVTVLAGLAAATLIPVLAVLITYEVVSRYAFRAPTSWAFEVSYMLMGISLMLGIAWCTFAAQAHPRRLSLRQSGAERQSRGRYSGLRVSPTPDPDLGLLGAFRLLPRSLQGERGIG